MNLGGPGVTDGNIYVNRFECYGVETKDCDFGPRMLAIFTLSLFLLLSPTSSVLAEENILKTAGTIPDGDYHAEDFVGSFGETIRIEFESDKDIDLIMTNVDGYNDYRDPGEEYFTTYPEGTSYQIRQVDLDFFVPADGTYYIIVDNSDIPDSGAMPQGSVNYSIELTRIGDEYDTELLTTICIIAGVIVLILIVGVIYVVLVRLAKKSRAESGKSATKSASTPIYDQSSAKGPMNCPACGAFSSHGSYCIECGRRLR